jgi:hypothetical protein
MLLPLKGLSAKIVSIVEQFYPRPITFMLKFALGLKKKSILRGGWDAALNISVNS